MSRLTYYSPLWIGTLLAAIVASGSYDQLPAMFLAGGSKALSALYIGLGSVAIGLVCQLGMLGCQGVFAQVLPAPGGRSVRGRGPTLCGVLILLAIMTGVGSATFYIGSVEDDRAISGALTLMVILFAASTVGALVVYFWSWPTAVRDFADE
jgi:hypothetical protein